MTTSPKAKTIAIVIVVLLAALGYRDSRQEARQLRKTMAETSQAGLTYAPLSTGVVDIALCEQTVRLAGSVERLLDQPPSSVAVLPTVASRVRLFYTSSTSVSVEPTISDRDPFEVVPEQLFAGLPAADPSVVVQIDWILEQLVACRFIPTSLGQPDHRWEMETYFENRLFSLYSDDYFRFNCWCADREQPFIDPFWIPVGPFPWFVREAHVLPDSRVIADIVPSAPSGEWLDSLVMVFALTEGDWRIDELGVVNPRWEGADQNAAQFYDIELHDLGFRVRDIDPLWYAGFVLDSPVTVTVANLGMTRKELIMPDFGVDLVIEPGHSSSFALDPTIGDYSIRAYALTGEPVAQRWLLAERTLDVRPIDAFEDY